MSVQDAMQAVIDELKGELDILRNQRPEQFDRENLKRGLALKSLRTKRIKELLDKALALQREVARNLR
jgi:hypothetical protein